MKPVKMLVLILAMLNIFSTQTIPKAGYFVFTRFQDSSCTNGVKRAIGYGKDSCFALVDGESLHPLSWDSTTGELTSDYYLNSVNCSGTATAQNMKMACDGRCQSDLSGSYSSCKYSNMPSTGSFVIGVYTEDTCKPSTGFSVSYLATDTCWLSEVGSSSYVPFNFNTRTNVLSLFIFNTSTNCLTYNPANPYITGLTCDGVCEGITGTNSYSLCTYNSSAHLVLSLILTFAMIFILI